MEVYGRFGRPHDVEDQSYRQQQSRFSHALNFERILEKRLSYEVLGDITCLLVLRGVSISLLHYSPIPPFNIH